MRNRRSAVLHRATRQYSCDPLEARQLLSAGALDTSFNTTGKAAFTSSQGLQVNDVAAQSNGKTIVVATYSTGPGSVYVERLNVDGSLDTTFGPNGTGVIELTKIDGSGALHDTATAMVVQPADDKIVIVGNETLVNDENYAFIARLNANGTWDTAFGFGGITAIFKYDSDASLYNTASDVAIQTDGKIVLAGSANDHGLDFDFAVARLNTDGSLDNSFAGDGTTEISVGASEFAQRLAIDYSGTSTTNPNYGKIVVAGYEFQGAAFAVARLNSNGSLDNTFSGDGKLTSSFGSQYNQEFCRGLVVQSTGKIVIEGDVYLTGSTSPQIGLFRLNANGLGDSTFGTSNGQAILSPTAGAGAGGLINGQAGRLIVGAYLGTTTQVVCLSTDGVIDPYFGTSGILTINFGVPFDPSAGSNATDFVLEPGGTIVVGGGGGDDIARFFDRKAETVSIGTLQPIMYEQGQQGTTFLVTRLERLSTAQRVFLNVSGTATAPGNVGRHPIDYTGTNITFPTAGFGSTYVDIPANETFVEVTITPVDDTLVEGDETAIFSIAASSDYDAVTPTSTTLTIRDNDIAAGPSVRSSSFNYDSGSPQNVTFAFDQDVSSSIGANDFTVTGPSGAVPFTLAYDNVNDLATLKFSSILADGNYTATAIASGITNSAGTHMTSNSALSFFFLNADANHDRTVNALDFNALATNYGNPGTFSQGDFNYSGTVDSNDFAILASRYGTTLAAPTGADQPAAAARLATSLTSNPANLFAAKPITASDLNADLLN